MPRLGAEAVGALVDDAVALARPVVDLAFVLRRLAQTDAGQRRIESIDPVFVECPNRRPDALDDLVLGLGPDFAIS